MATDLEVALKSAQLLISDTSKLVRVVLSGRRRNMSVPFERIDIRPVLIKGVITLQVAQNDGRITTTKNVEANKYTYSKISIVYFFILAIALSLKGKK